MRTPHRRTVRVGIGAVAVFLAGLVWLGAGPRPDPDPWPTTADDALAELVAGNKRFVASHRRRSTDTAHDADDRRALAGGQHPFAAVLTCADSRVCPEILFDQRLGSLFEIRNAGNVVDDDVEASFEYAVDHLHVPLIVVLGHKGCGAVAAVHEAAGNPLPFHLKALQDHMAGLRPDSLRSAGDHSPECLDRLVRVNARTQAEDLLRESEPIRAAVRSGTVRLVYAVYDIRTGEIEFVPLGP